MTTRRGTAVVIGASMAGLAGAAALSEHFDRVILLDRDHDLDTDSPRKAVPQGAHAHGLLAAGLQGLETLLPGLTDELVMSGAQPGDVQRDVQWVLDGALLADGVSGMLGLTVARPVLELQVRDRVRALPNVTVRSACRVSELLVRDGNRPRVTGVSVRDADDNASTIDADLVVDASGRTSQLPKWLEMRGFAPPAEEAVGIDVTYTTRLYKRLDHHLGGGVGLVMAPIASCPSGSAVLAIDADTWIVTVFGMVGNAAPTDDDGFLDYASRLPGPQVRDLLVDSAPLADPLRYRVRASVRHRYEDLRRLPEGCIAIGDSIAAFNPVYGQGMTTAVLEAQALGRLLASTDDDRKLARRYFQRASRIVDVAWDMSAGGDFRIPGVVGTPTAKMRMANAYLPRVLRAAHHHPETATAVLRVVHMMSRPESLFGPRTMGRALFSH